MTLLPCPRGVEVSDSLISVHCATSMGTKTSGNKSGWKSEIKYGGDSLIRLWARNQEADQKAADAAQELALIAAEKEASAIPNNIARHKKA